MMNKFAVTCAIACLASSPAWADSDTGPRLEAHLGWDSLAIPDQTGTAAAQSPSSRLLYGAGAGYDLSLGGNVIAGVETNFDLGSGTQCSGPVLGTSDSLCGQMAHDWDVGARLGLKEGPALVYARIAYDSTRVQSTYLPGDGTSASVSSNYDGVRFGGGAEMPLTGKSYLKAEYRYTVESGLPDQNQLLAGVGLRF